MNRFVAVLARLERVRAWIHGVAAQPAAILAALRRIETALRVAEAHLAAEQDVLADLRRSTGARAELVTSLGVLVREARDLVRELHELLDAQGAPTTSPGPDEPPLPEMAVEPPANDPDAAPQGTEP